MSKIFSKWKNGMICFLFFNLLVSVLLMLFYQQDFFKNLSEFETSSIIVFIVLILLTILFLYSISKTEKKIIENKYSLSWLVKFNLLFLLPISYVLGFLLSVVIVVISILTEQSSSSSLAPNLILLVPLIYIFSFYSILPAIFALLLFVSFLPSLFFRKFYSSAKFFRKITLIFLILNICLFLVFLIGKIKCDFNGDPFCVASKAIKTENIKLCDKVRGNEGESCYSNAVFGIVDKTQNINICEDIPIATPSNENVSRFGFHGDYYGDTYNNNGIKNECYKDVLRTNTMENSSIFKKIDFCENVSPYFRDKCFEEIDEYIKQDCSEGGNLDKGMCGKYSKQFTEAISNKIKFCERKEAVSELVPNFCISLTSDEDLRYECELGNLPKDVCGRYDQP